MNKIRAEITKGEAVRYLSHLDYAAAIERAVRRAKLPAAYSEGFNPHMKLAFASALAVGVTSDAEYMDIEFQAPVTAASFSRRMGETLPAGIAVRQAVELPGRQPALMAQVDSAAYTAALPFAGDFAAAERSLAAFNAAPEVWFTRRTPKRAKEVELKQYLAAPVALTREAGELRFVFAVRIAPSGSVKPGEIVQALREQFALEIEAAALLVHRTGLWARGRKPIDIVWRDEA